MFCSNCGSAISNKDNICPSCGNSTKDTTLRSAVPDFKKERGFPTVAIIAITIAALLGIGYFYQYGMPINNKYSAIAYEKEVLPLLEQVHNLALLTRDPLLAFGADQISQSDLLTQMISSESSCTSLLSQLKAISPSGGNLVKSHAQLLNAASQFCNGISQITEGIKNTNVALVQKGAATIQTATAAMNTYNESINSVSSNLK